MSIVSGITPKGTIWIKNLDEKGRLISGPCEFSS